MPRIESYFTVIKALLQHFHRSMYSCKVVMSEYREINGSHIPNYYF